jgi:2-oxoglutarate ferredoxin oxidoreductase subunit gamma
MRAEIRVAGFGGQGVITFGFVLAQAASIYDEKYALMTQSYGPEARGGACRSDVVISDVSIDYPKLSKITCFVAMSIDAYNQFNKTVKPGAIVILEEDLVQVSDKDLMEGVTYYSIPSVREAEALGNRLAANMVMLGAAQAVTQAVSEESLEEAIRQRFPRYTELNIKALHRGIALGKEAMEEE